jgi:hypothetical protein
MSAVHAYIHACSYTDKKVKWKIPALFGFLEKIGEKAKGGQKNV